MGQICSRRALSVILAGVIILSGFPAPRIWAANIRLGKTLAMGRLPAPVLNGIPAALGALRVFEPGSAVLNLAPGLSGRSATATMSPAVKDIPSVAAAADMAAAEIAALENISLTGENAASGGERLENLMTGGKSVADKDELGAMVLAASVSDPAPAGLARPSLSSSLPHGRKVPLAASTRESRPTRSRLVYGMKRMALAAIASAFGIVSSLPVIGPRLEQRVLAQAARKRVVFSDYDSTLGPWRSVLSPDMVAAIAAVRLAGKEITIISDRPAVKSEGCPVTIFESLASVPAAVRAGMYVAAYYGGQLYRYDAQGAPELIWEFPPLDGDIKARVQEAIDSLKARLPRLGTAQFPGDHNIPAESWDRYGYGMMLAVGTPEPVVHNVARAFQTELSRRGFDVLVAGHMAKDPANPPYVNFSIVNKSPVVRQIAARLKAEPWESLVLGDSMYLPRQPETSGFVARAALRWAERLSGRPLPLTGHETDRNMERALPGILSLSVGGAADPRMARAYVLRGRGPEAAREVLRAVASQPAVAADPARYWQIAAVVLALAAVIGIFIVGWLTFGVAAALP
ncbi:MAG TPA: hypothetical protein DEB40_10645 [Elusimicrobia bacterium]|nr:hypothetical protein [Elusimicrobiota bacterium]HBT62188.1 hypothetical protein [Elusimicrobiota bacterium]